MAVNFSDDLIAHVMDVFSRPITVTPIISQPTAPAYAARAYYGTKGLDVMTEGGSIFSDAETYIDLRKIEFTVVPMQGDHISMGAHAGMDAGDWEVLDLSPDGDAAGYVTATLRKIVTPKPTP